jgi:hypothetical protein
MDSSTILGLAGVIISVVFGVWGIYVAIRRKRYPGGIDLFIESSIGLFDFKRNWNELVVSYKNKVVNQSSNIVLLVGVWHNTGSIDITPGMTERKLALNLPPGYTWLDGKKILTASRVDAKAIVSSPTSLEFDIKLFKCDEHIRFEALAEVPSLEKDQSTRSVGSPGDRLVEALKIEYRIEHMGKVQIEDMSSLGLASKSRMRKSALASALVLAFCFAASFTWLPVKKSPTYLMNDSKQEVELNFNAPGSLVFVKDVSTGHEDTLQTAVVKRRGYALAPVKLSSLILPFVLIVIPAPAAIFLTSFYIDRKRRRERGRFLASCVPYPSENQLANEN